MKKVIAVILELIPIISAILSFVLIMMPFDSDIIRKITPITVALAFLGFLFFFIGRKLAKGDAAVLILGILDWLATIGIIALYAIAIFNFGQ